MAQVLLAKSGASSLYLSGTTGFALDNKLIKLPSESGSIALTSGVVTGVGNGLSLDESRVASVNIKSGEKILSAGTDGLASTLSINWDKTNKKVQLLGIGNANISEFDATDFVKDGMLNNVELSSAGGKDYLVFTWNTDAGKSTLPVEITKFPNVYTASNGVKLIDKDFQADFDVVASQTWVENKGYAVSADVDEKFLTKTDAASTYATTGSLENFKSHVASTYATTAALDNFKNTVASTYETQSHAASTYETSSHAASTYATKTALEAVTKALSGTSKVWAEVTLEDVYALVKEMAKVMGATIS